MANNDARDLRENTRALIRFTTATEKLSRVCEALNSNLVAIHAELHKTREAKTVGIENLDALKPDSKKIHLFCANCNDGSHETGALENFCTCCVSRHHNTPKVVRRSIDRDSRLTTEALYGTCMLCTGSRCVMVTEPSENCKCCKSSHKKPSNENIHEFCNCGEKCSCMIESEVCERCKKKHI